MFPIAEASFKWKTHKNNPSQRGSSNIIQFVIICWSGFPLFLKIDLACVLRPKKKKKRKKEKDDIGFGVNKFGILYSKVLTSYFIKGSGNVLSNRCS